MPNPTMYDKFPGEISLDNLDALFAHQRDRFGGVRMELDESTEEESTEDNEAGDESTEDESTDEQSSEDEESEDKDGEGEPELDLENALAALTKTRQSEAKMRTRLRDIEAKLADAKTPEQIEEILAGARKETADENKALMVENVALKFKLPDDLSAALKGDTREELEAHAKVLAKYAPADDEDPDLSGGLDPSNPSASAADQHKALVASMTNRRSYHR